MLFSRAVQLQPAVWIHRNDFSKQLVPRSLDIVTKAAELAARGAASNMELRADDQRRSACEPAPQRARVHTRNIS